MTEAGEKWAVEFWKNNGVPELAGIGLKRTEALLRAFCNEVEKRAESMMPKQPSDRSAAHARRLRKAFEELKRELLG